LPIEVLEARGFPAERGHVVHEPVRAEIVERSGHAMLFDIAAARAVDQSEPAEPSSDQARVVDVTNAQHAIEALPDHVHLPIRAADIYLEQRVRAQEFA